MEINQLITEKYGSLTKSEKKVANYIFSSSDKIIHNTMNDIKKVTKVGDATIIRFCQKLGFSGFSDLKIEIGKELYYSKELKNTQDISWNEIEKNIVDTIRATKTKIDDQILKEAVNLISTTSSIYIFGVGTSGNTAKDLEAMFLRIGVKTRAIVDSHFQLQAASLLNKKDLVIGISLSGKTKDTFDSLKIAKDHQANIMVLTNYLLSPIAKLSTVVLQTTTDEFFDGGSLSGKISQLYVCELLVKSYEKEHEETSLYNRESVIRAVINKKIE